MSLWSTLYTYGQLSFSFRIPEKLIISLGRLSLDCSSYLKCSVPYCYTFAKFDAHHHHRYQLHTHLLLHFCLCRPGQDCCYTDSYHSGHQHHLGLGHIALGWRQMGSCPVLDRKMVNIETFCMCQCRHCNVRDVLKQLFKQLGPIFPISMNTTPMPTAVHRRLPGSKYISAGIWVWGMWSLCAQFIFSLNRTLNHTCKTKRF